MDNTPEPNSPEAMRAARKVRDIFFVIAVLNVVAAIIIMCVWRDPPKTVPVPPSTLEPTPAPAKSGL